MFELKLRVESKYKKRNDSGLVYFVLRENLEEDLKKLEENYSFSLPAYTKKSFKNDENSELKYYPDGEIDIVIIKKVTKNSLDNDYFRNTCAGIIQNLKSESIKFLSFELPNFDEFNEVFRDQKQLYSSIIEGIYLGNYSFNKYKNVNNSKKLTISLLSDKVEDLRGILQETQNLMSAVYFSRDLVNEPAITLTPNELSKRTKEELQKSGVKVKVFNKNELKKMNMTGILAVGSSSENPPCLIEMHYKPRKVKKKIALVGKGITYDSGGLSIKPTSGMTDMMADMAGAGSVIGTVLAVAKNKLPVEIIAMVPAAENMISGSSYKPGDVVKTYSGKSIEVQNTDAEGRIALADALEYVMKKKPELTIDLATLTGSCVAALGKFQAGLFTKDDKLAGLLEKAGLNSYERVWRMPFGDEYNELIKSEVADVANLGSKWAGAITAGKFLEYFVNENHSWAHIDIAGPAIKHKFKNYTNKYHTGFGVRLLYEFLSELD